MATQRRRARRPNGTDPLPVRSVRVADAPWTKAERRAAFEGVTMSYVLATLTEGYANGQISLPRVQVVYEQPAGEVA